LLSDPMAVSKTALRCPCPKILRRYKISSIKHCVLSTKNARPVAGTGVNPVVPPRLGASKTKRADDGA